MILVIAGMFSQTYNAPNPHSEDMKGLTMAKPLVAAFVLVATVATVSSPVLAQGGGAAADVAAITGIVNGVAKADLAGDTSYYQNQLSDDWTGGTSRGTYDTKASLLADMRDTKNNKTSSESIANIKVRTHGDVAIATYSQTYDATIKGQHYARTVICTDTLHRMSGAWKTIAGHCSQAAK